MNTRRLTHHPVSILLIACAIFALQLSACQPEVVSTSLPAVQSTAAQPPAVQPTATQAPVQATQPASAASGDITLDLSGVAQSQITETVAAVAATADEPSWQAAPQYHRMTLQDYLIAYQQNKPQIFIYPAADLGSANENMGKMATDLQALLKTQQAGDQLPFLPLMVSAKQAVDAQVQYLDFKSGKGVRFLTQAANGLVLINNNELIYTFQGLTTDGKYYISAVLPVTNPELPADSKLTDEMVKGVDDTPGYYTEYLTRTVTLLNQQASSSFTPDLAKLDAMIQSISVK